MFLNGGSLDNIRKTIDRVRDVGQSVGRYPKFAVYGIPVCRKTDRDARAVISVMLDRVDARLVEARK